MKRKRFWIMALALMLALLPARRIARAATYTVTNTNNAWWGSLRQAIIDANNNPGPDTIEFNIPIPGNYCDFITGVCIIQPTSPLPALTGGNTTIDGYTQPGAAEATDTTPAVFKIKISGSSAGAGADGLTITSANNVIKGLVIRRFSSDGVSISGDGATGNTVSGNYIGTNTDGTADQGNTYDGVRICNGAQNNTVGGATAGERNVISGNNVCGISISGSGTTDNTIFGNYIGTDASGTTDLGNSWYGVYVGSGAQNNIVGGNTPGERNVISGNDRRGIYIYGSGTTGNTVSGNYIGTDAGGTTDLGNTYDGVYIGWGAQNNTVGSGNAIAYNGGDGVEVDGSSTTGNAITQNSIFSNTLGIDLTGGANGGIAAPTIFTTTAGSVKVVGTACPNCTVEVFENSDTDGEGETYVGGTTADNSGDFTVTVSSLSKPCLTATATDAVNGTSEFSAVFTATVSGAPPAGPVYLPIILKNH